MPVKSPAAIHFEILETLKEENSDIDIRIRATIFFDKKVDLRTRKQLYMQIPMNIALKGCDSWSLKASYFAKLTTAHHKCTP
jgi:hypothetical protein